ncbi:GntR family transcriptional regulator [Streptomyces sp. NBC_01622]|uniref:GntR family transcriptional regulator n=1 Tax=Streptomyces sp. NBC_01622 TaxID=2975903 RepID=UPI00386A536F|nr:GntR family transcriptional regulator [Streptomyces sp. NBC_01622]
MKSTRDTVYDTLSQRLTSGYYPADASLVPLALSEEFAVSRTPVREALVLLERDGLLVSTRRGFTLRLRSEEEMLELFGIRAALDATAAESAALRRSTVDMVRLDAHLDHGQSLNEPAHIRRSPNDWHDAVRQAAHNGTVVALLRTLGAQVKTSAPRRTPEVTDTSTAAFAEHRAITEAIRSRDAEAPGLPCSPTAVTTSFGSCPDIEVRAGRRRGGAPTSSRNTAAEPTPCSRCRCRIQAPS